jgi:chromate reductase
MADFRVAVLVGSLRKDSVNMKLAKAVVALAPKQLAFSFVTLPTTLFNEDLEAQPPTDWVAFRNALQTVDGLLFVTPEYNRSVPAVLKNAVDVASRPYGRSVIAKKPGAVISASPGALGGALANHHLRQSLMFCDVPLLQQPEVYLSGAFGVFDESGNIKTATVTPFLTKFGMEFAGWISTITHKH